jgi:hypothetical protein
MSPFERRGKAKEPLCHDHARLSVIINGRSELSGPRVSLLGSSNRTNLFDSGVLADRKGTPQVHEKTGASK